MEQRADGHPTPTESKKAAPTKRERGVELALDVLASLAFLEERGGSLPEVQDAAPSSSSSSSSSTGVLDAMRARAVANALEWSCELGKEARHMRPKTSAERAKKRGEEDVEEAEWHWTDELETKELLQLARAWNAMHGARVAWLTMDCEYLPAQTRAYGGDAGSGSGGSSDSSGSSNTAEVEERLRRVVEEWKDDLERADFVGWAEYPLHAPGAASLGLRLAERIAANFRMGAVPPKGTSDAMRGSLEALATSLSRRIIPFTSQPESGLWTARSGRTTPAEWLPGASAEDAVTLLACFGFARVETRACARLVSFLVASSATWMRDVDPLSLIIASHALANYHAAAPLPLSTTSPHKSVTYPSPWEHMRTVGRQPLHRWELDLLAPPKDGLARQAWSQGAKGWQRLDRRSRALSATFRAHEGLDAAAAEWLRRGVPPLDAPHPIPPPLVLAILRPFVRVAHPCPSLAERVKTWAQKEVIDPIAKRADLPPTPSTTGTMPPPDARTVFLRSIAGTLAGIMPLLGARMSMKGWLKT
jgi:hypothetical protein